VIHLTYQMVERGFVCEGNIFGLQVNRRLIQWVQFVGRATQQHNNSDVYNLLVALYSGHISERFREAPEGWTGQTSERGVQYHINREPYPSLTGQHILNFGGKMEFKFKIKMKDSDKIFHPDMGPGEFVTGVIDVHNIRSGMDEALALLDAKKWLIKKFIDIELEKVDNRNDLM
jgi:hypothetical protein